MSEDRLSLEVLGETRAPAELPRQGRLVIGSERERVDLLVDGAGVDPVHCAIGRLQSGGWALKDLGSDAGSFLNGERVTSARLHAGDVIELGSRRLRVFDPRAPQPAVTANAPAANAANAPAANAANTSAARAPARTNGGSELHIKGYTLEKLLGRGAMGEVWLAVQESLRRKVALKMLSPRLEADLDFVRRFQAEARAAAALNHPNVVTVHDVGADGGHHYLTMEFMAHGCLESRVASLGPLAWRDVLAILRDAAAGLVYAEQRGIVHRDIKPANLMQDEHGVTKIADLGLASQVEQEELQGERGKVFGTPHFLAPEVIRGTAPDAKSDLYSLGATAYRLLTGKTPFDGATSRDILRAALRDEPALPSKLRAGIPPELDRLVMRLLAKEPAQRAPSAGALLAEIESIRRASAPQATARSRATRYVLLLGLLTLVAAAVWQLAPWKERRTTPENETLASSDNPNDVSRERPTPELDAPPETTTETRALPENTDDGGASAFGEREAKARELHSSISNQVLSDGARAAALRTLASAYEGTDTGIVALREAEALEAKAAGERGAADQVANEREGLLAAMRRALEEGEQEGGTSEAFVRLRAVPGQDAYAGDEVFRRERERLEDAALERAVEAARALHERADELESGGRFEEYESLLKSWTQSVGLPEFPADDVPQAARDLADLVVRARKRIDEIEASRLQFLALQRASDARTLAEELGGRDGLEAELGRMDLEAAGERIDRALTRIVGDEQRRELTVLRRELTLARSSFAALAQAWEKGEWRRKTINDPRPRRDAAREAVRADERGVWLEGDTGLELIEWSAWAEQALEIDKLFHGRLDRPWSESELEGIVTLVRIAASIALVRRAEATLDPLRSERFSEAEAEAARASFAITEPWELPPRLRARAERDRAAGDLLVDALRAQDEGAFSRAVDYLEHLLEEQPLSLLVLLRSDGSEWRESRPEPEASGEAREEGDG